MEIMEGVYLHLLLLLVTLIQGIQGQTVTPSSKALAVGDGVSLECITTTTRDSITFTWSHITPTEAVVVYAGGNKEPADGEYENFDIDEDIPGKRSTLIINDILRQDEGQYRCSASGQTDIPLATVTVEVGSPSPLEPIELISIDADSSSTYQATCDAIGSSPEETITWILDGVTQTDGIVETDPGMSDDNSLFEKRSVFTFPATTDNYEMQLECNISGHQVAKLNRQESRLLDIHKRPQPEGIVIGFTSAGEDLILVSCNTNTDVAAAKPAMSTFYIYIYPNRTLITNPELDNAVTITEPEQDTEFTCVGGNYLGNTTTTQNYPGSTTTPPPTTEPIAPGGNMTTPSATEGTSPVVDSGTPGTEPEGLSAGAVAGIVIGVIACIVIIIVVILYLVKPECCPCFATAGLKSSGSGKKPAGSAVGSSNGSEKDKINQPVAAQRSQAPIQHTASNPGQELYALPERKQPAGGRGGDAPDRGSGPGQNEPQDIFYAALDLSSKAGHTEKHIPKNENDVVVYSSILV